MTTKSNEEIVREFKRYQGLILTGDTPRPFLLEPVAVDWLRTTLHQQLQSIHTSLVAAVEGMKEDGDTPFGTQELHETELAYNKALDDTLTIINSIFKE